MTNKEKDLIIKALETLKHEVYFGSYLTAHSSMNIEEKAYAEKEMNDIDILIKDIKANTDNEKIKIFDYLSANWVHKAYNPHGMYHVISFDIKDENIMKSLDKYLKGERIEMYVGDVKHG